jgi:FHA domain-containing protein
MVKCPFCSFDNEDGALFCEQCKSDLGHAETAPIPVVAVPIAAAPVMAAAVAVATAEPIAEATPLIAAPVAEPMLDAAPPIPVAAPIPETPPVVAEVAVPPPPSDVTPPEPVSVPVVESAAPAQEVKAMPKLVVLRGLKINAEYPIYPGENFIGRADEKPVDIDLEDQEQPDRVWSSRQHAVIIVDEATGNMTIEDLNSSNGTFVNRTKVYPGQKRDLHTNDVIQIGTVQMKVKL